MRALTGRTAHRAKVSAIQFLIVAVLLVLWQYLPTVGWVRDRFNFMDPFFISSPSQVWTTLQEMIAGSNGRPHLWPYFISTVEAALIGTVVGTLLGAAGGLLLSNSPRLNEILHPFVLALNAIPRIALIPIIVILFGPTLKASAVTAITVVFFVVFFNAYEGGRTVPRETIQNATMLGGNSRQMMLRIRWPFVLAWTVTALPNAVSFGLVSVVTAEVLTGTIGMGRLLLDSVTSVQAALTFAVVLVLSVLGVLLVTSTELIRRRWLHWWVPSE
jgi:NitT/TauT family transport system permease protein